MSSTTIAGVVLELREDRTFTIYQPDSSRVLSQEAAEEVAWFILRSYSDPVDVPLSRTGREADKNAAEARAAMVEESIARGVADAEAGRVKELPEVTEPKPAPKRRGRPRKTT